MKIVSKVWFALAALAGFCMGSAAEVRWIEKDYDFGLMKESSGPKTGISRFVNLGPDTVSIFSVKPSCGCTSTKFSDEPIAPGDTAVVAYTYDPDMRPGKFDKTVRVRLSDGSHHTIRIVGNVLGTPESLASLYPLDAGDMRLSQAAVNGNQVVFGRCPVFFLNAYSLPLDSIGSKLISPERSLVVTQGKPLTGPGEIKTFSIIFNSGMYGQYGPVSIPMEFTANPEAGASPTVTIPFRAFVLPDTEQLLIKQKGRNPNCEVLPEVLPIERTSGAEPVKCEIEVENRGSGPLHILRIASNTFDVKVPKMPKEIKPGKKAKIKLEIDGATLPQETFRLPLYIITDDPGHPQRSISVTGL